MYLCLNFGFVGFDGDTCLGRLTDEKAVSCFKQNYVSFATALPFLIKAFHPDDKRQLYKKFIHAFLVLKWDVIRQHSTFTSVCDLYHAMKS